MRKSRIALYLLALAVPNASAFSAINRNLKPFTQPLAFHDVMNLHVLQAETVGMSPGVGSNIPPGMIKQVKKAGNGLPIQIGDVATVKYTCDIIDESTGERSKSGSFSKSSAQKFVVGDGLMIDGWEFALQSMRGGERSIVRLTDPRLGYGTAGVPPIIPANAIVEMDLEILEVEAGVDLGTIASADPLKPVSHSLSSYFC